MFHALRRHSFRGTRTARSLWNPFAEGLYPLHLAVQLGNYEMVRLLVTSGADVDAKTSQGRTALDFAREVPPDSKRLEIIAFLARGHQIMHVRDLLHRSPTVRA